MATPSFFTVGPLVNINLGFASLPTYYLVISLTYCLCILWLYRRSEQRGLSAQTAMDICLIVLIGGFLGARMAHIFFERPSYYWSNPVEIFSFWQGGFVFYGGALFAYACGLAYVYFKKLKIGAWHDTVAPVIALGYALGRTACFAVGCCYGKVCDLPWAYNMKQVDFHSGAISHMHRHPTQLYAFFTELIILGFLLYYEKRKPKPGSVFLIWAILHSLGRILMENFRDDPRGPSVLGLSVSTAISIVIGTLALTKMGLIFFGSKPTSDSALK